MRETSGLARHFREASGAGRKRMRTKMATRDESERIDKYNAAVMELKQDHNKLRDALEQILPLATDFLSSAPSHPDNAKLETARAALATTRRRP